jgi:hypothetical protein
MPVCRPPPHRHDLEEMFTIPDGEIGLTFRGRLGGSCGFDREHPGQRTPLLQGCVGQTGAAALHVHPGRAGGVFHVGRRSPRHPYCASHIAPPPVRGKDEQGERVRRAKALAAKYQTELRVWGTLFRGRVTRSRQCRTCEA